MNSEQLILEAGDAIAEWQRTHNRICHLCLENGHVKCKATTGMRQYEEHILNITVWQQRNGLTSNRWDLIGTKLWNLYNKEKACQEHQKH